MHLDVGVGFSADIHVYKYKFIRKIYTLFVYFSLCTGARISIFMFYPLCPNHPNIFCGCILAARSLPHFSFLPTSTLSHFSCHEMFLTMSCIISQKENECHYLSAIRTRRNSDRERVLAWYRIITKNPRSRARARGFCNLLVVFTKSLSSLWIYFCHSSLCFMCLVMPNYEGLVPPLTRAQAVLNPNTKQLFGPFTTCLHYQFIGHKDNLMGS